MIGGKEMKWQRLFSNRILDRGFDYYKKGFVTHFESGQNYVKGIVLGNRKYNVSIDISNGKIFDMNCDCPYAYQGDHCKHMVALLFHMDSDTEINENPEKASPTKDSIMALIKDADEESIRDALSVILENDEKLYLRFKHALHGKFSANDVKIYRNQIDSIFERHTEIDEYIEYYNAYSFISELTEFLEENIHQMLKTRQHETALELTNYLFVKLGDQDIEDSDGGINTIAEMCIDIWRTILKDCDMKIKKDMFEWCISHLDGSVIDYMEEYIESIFFDNFLEEEFLDDKIKFTEDRIIQYKKEKDSWSNRYYIGNWAMHLINLMKQKKVSDSTIEEYCTENSDFDVVRKYYIEKCIKKKDYETAIHLSKDGKEKAGDAIGLVIDYGLKLKQLYSQIGNQKEYENELWFLMLKCKTDNIDIYKELRDFYTETEWKEKREIIFSALLLSDSVDALYEEEQLYDRLLKKVLDSSELNKLMKYETCLKTIYPNELLEKYETTVKNMATKTASRRHYQEIVNILKRMKEYPDGSHRVNKIVDEWRIVYKKRSAMMEELNKITE